jgi:pimeloyl-ACP methyl ester carboxylesterase
MHYEEQGEGDPVILIHGLTMDHVGWSFQFQAFSAQHRVIVFDNRGVGRTDSPEEPFTTKTMADDVAGLMDVLGIQKAHLVGLSLGGMVAQQFALSHPERLDRLVLAATAAHPSGGAPRSAHIVENLLTMSTEGVGLEERTRMFMTWAFTAEFFEDPKQAQLMVNLVTSAPHPQSSEGLAGQIAAVKEHDTREQLAGIKAPTLVLVGEEDLLLPVRLSRELAESIQGARLLVVEGAGHLFCIEHPGEFNRAVLKFFQEPTEPA